MSFGSMALYERREPSVNLLTIIIFKYISVENVNSNVFNTYLSFSDWYPKYGDKK